MSLLAGLLLLWQLQNDPAELFRQGRLSEAESAARDALARSPAEPRSLMLMAVVLDAQQRYREAEPYHRKLSTLLPGAPQVWNNFGNHWWARQQLDQARRAFERAVALDVTHANANLQLARIAVAQGRGADALPYLERLGVAASSDPALLVLYGRALTDKRDYPGAEKMFAAALERVPGDIDVRIALGLAALNAGNHERALDVFETARTQQPSNTDVLYGLARAYVESGQLERAFSVLGEARKLQPDRDDVLALLARSAAQAGFYADSAQAWSDYLKLKPDVHAARRERAFALVRARDSRGASELEAYVSEYPNDAVARFQLGIAYGTSDPARAIEQFGRSLSVAPNNADALYARGTLLARDGKAAEAAKDLERAVQLDPKNANALGRLGQLYRQFGRTAHAERLLRRAAELNPNDRATAMHLAFILRDTGKRDEADKYFAVVKGQLGTDASHTPRTGLLEFLSMAPEQQGERYIANLRRAVEDQPANEDLRLRLGLTLLERGDAAGAEQVLQSLKTAPAVTDGELALIGAERFEAARKLLQQAAQPSVELAIAEFRIAGPEAGLATLDRVPERSRDGDYWLARAQILDGAGQFEPALQALNNSFAAAPTQAPLYHHAAKFLIKHDKLAEASRLLEQANKLIPNEPQLLLDHAVVLELAKRFEEARTVLASIERRWPEWARPFVVHGISFMTRGKASEALPLLETAIALGDDSAEAHYYLAQALLDVSPEHRGRAALEVKRALERAPEDPYAHVLAGRIAIDSGEFETALKHLKRSTQLLPGQVDAHYQLMRAYSALGRKAEARAESEQVRRLREAGEPKSPLSNTLRSELFGVKNER
ncbi:MAG TPA: tetratricopeptide repeat protein [Bryobacteraceae bacterium]|nr:tetratricopeptide repeat protein [Bryobacteraceae bacterium]